MPKYLLVYHGGGGGMNATPEQQQQIMNAWMGWFGQLGPAVVDGGNPIGRAVTLTGKGQNEGGGANPATGYSVLQANSLEAAIEMAKGCPHLQDTNGSVEVCETFEVG